MEDFMTFVAQVVDGAILEEMLSRGVAMALGKRKEKASQRQYQEMLKKAAKEVEFVLERTAKLPITELSLLQDRFELRRDFIHAACLLISSRNEKRQARQAQQEMPQAVSSGSCSRSPQGFFARPAMFSVSSLVADMSKDDELCLSCDDVERFEQFADSARSILSRVESGCSLRRYMFFPCPLVRRLFDDQRTLLYRTEQADEARGLYVWPARLEEGHGVEVHMYYKYLNRKRAEKSFSLWLGLRVSESTDILGVAMNCLRSLASQFNFVADTAVGELTLLAGNLHDVSPSHAPSWVGIQEHHCEIIQMGRPDPWCCQAKGREHCAINNVVSSSELSHIVPEEDINYFRFNCYISAPDQYNLRSSSSSAGERTRRRRRSVMRNRRRPPLQLGVCLVPHHVHDERQQASYAAEVIGDSCYNGERLDVSIQQLGGEMARTRAINCFLRQPKVTKYAIMWVAKHGAVGFIVEQLPAAAV